MLPHHGSRLPPRLLQPGDRIMNIGLKVCNRRRPKMASVDKGHGGGSSGQVSFGEAQVDEFCHFDKPWAMLEEGWHRAAG
jgi:hypothetical protein